jgi:hypothetical protein
MVDRNEVPLLAGQIGRNQNEILYNLGRLELRVRESHALSIDLAQRCHALSERLDAQAPLPLRRRTLIAYDLAMWVSLVVSIFELFGNPPVGLQLFEKLGNHFPDGTSAIAQPIVSATRVPTPAFENYVLQALPREGVDSITGSIYQPAPQLVPFYQKLFSLYGNTSGTPLANVALERVREAEGRCIEFEQRMAGSSLPRQELLLSLAQDLPAVWNACPDMRLKQRILHLVLREVRVDVDSHSRQVILLLHWAGGRNSHERARRMVAAEVINGDCQR